MIRSSPALDMGLSSGQKSLVGRKTASSSRTPRKPPIPRLLTSQGPPEEAEAVAAASSAWRFTSPSSPGVGPSLCLRFPPPRPLLPAFSKGPRPPLSRFSSLPTGAQRFLGGGVAGKRPGVILLLAGHPPRRAVVRREEKRRGLPPGRKGGLARPSARGHRLQNAAEPREDPGS